MSTQGKPIVYQTPPEYDQATQYVVQGEPEDRGDCVFYPCLVLELPEEDAEEEPV